MAAFTMNDAITKVASASMNMGQVMLVRGLFAMLLVGLLAWHQGALRAPRAVLQPMLILRVLAEVGATVCFLLALAHLPIANVSAVLQALPLAVTMGAALAFSEPVGWRRWLAISIGFLGVVVVVRPGRLPASSRTAWCSSAGSSPTLACRAAARSCSSA